jgi:hypothetical protein
MLENADISLKGKVITLDADDKHDERYQKMLLSESFGKETKVVVTTSVIDNGVNFRDVDNVVISDVSRVKCLQQLGRARVDRNNPHSVTLYLKRFNERYMKNRIAYLNEQKMAYHRYNLAYRFNHVEYLQKYDLEFLNKYYNGRPEDFERAKHWFGRDTKVPARLYPNPIAQHLLDRLIPMYESILEEMQRTDIGEVTGQRYLEYQLSWFGKEYDIANDITLSGSEMDKAKKELIDFLESCVGKQMFGDEQDKFREKFTSLCIEAFGEQDKNKDRKYAIAKINKILQKYNLNYNVKNDRMTTGNKETYWEVIRFNWESDNPKSE